MVLSSLLSVALIISLCGRFSVAQDAVTVILEPPRFVILGASFELRCTTQGIGVVQQFKWYHNQTEITTEQRFSVRESGSLLSVGSSMRQDGGEYHCQAFISGNPNPINSTSHIVKIEGIYSVTTDQAVYEAELHSTLTVTCIVDADPSVTSIMWTREGSQDSITQHSDDPMFGILQKTATLEDDGRWICSASSSLDDLDAVFTVVVLVPPSNTAITLGTSTPILRGQEFRLECSARGNRAPNFTWTFSDATNHTELLMSNSRYSSDSARGETLIVSTATYRDAGTYTCTATNEAGTDTASINIEIEGAPEILTDQPTSPIRAGIHLGVSLRCPFFSNPPPTNVEWKKGAIPIQSGDQYQISANTLNVSRFDTTGRVNFTCIISNEHGEESRTFNLLVQDVPAPPTNLNFEVSPDDPRAITVTWTESVQNGPVDEVEDYVVEESFNGQEFKLTDYVFQGSPSSGVVYDLYPGELYVFRLRARNVAGLSQPSNNVTYMTPPGSPMLSFFTASALDGGRSVLLEWELAFDGGNDLSNFTVEILLSNDLVLIVPLAMESPQGRQVVTGLKHDSRYEFRVVLTNAAGRTSNFTSGFNTTVAPPDQPSRPVVTVKTTSSIKISFSVEFGTEPITHFLLNITGTKAETEVQKRFPIDAVKYIDSLEDIVNSEGIVIGYRVEMVLTGLTEREVYQFEVAAESSIGVGEFSEPSDNAKLEDDRILYFIICGVFGGMFLIVIPIAVLALFCYGKQRYSQRKKTITINSNGSHAFSPSEDIDNAFTKATTPSVRQHSRETLTSTTNSYFGNGHIHSSIIKQESYDREKVTASPPYNRLGESPLPSGVSIGIKTDSVIDIPEENDTVVQTYFAGGKVAYNPQYNHHVPAQYSPRPQHMQLQLQTSFNDLQSQTESPSPSEKYSETAMSEKRSLSNSHNTLCVPGANLSRSNPAISNRVSCDSMLVPPGPTSQATDV